jgi:drug/metabolite transporter (DMT)-like permease
MCIYTGIKYFPVIFVTLVQNISPLLIALFSYLLYKVSLSRLDSLNLIISFTGVIILITGTLNGDASSEAQFSVSELIIPTICMILIPFNGACINLFLREMKDMNEITLAAYIIFAMFIIYFPIVIFAYDFTYLADFDWIDWLVCVLLGFTSVFLQITKALSVKYEEPAKTAVLNYFQPIIQLILDILFLKTDFTGQ